MNSLTGPLLVVLGVLVVAGAAKVRAPSPTATALDALRVPKPLLAARVLGVAEVVIGLAAAVFGSPWLLAAVAAFYAGFTAFILWALSGNQADISCGCFGHEDTPPTVGHAAFNAAASAIAALAIVNPVSITDFDGTLAEAALAAILTVLAVVVSIAALTAVPRNLALVQGTAAPRSPEFSLRTPPTTTRSKRGTT